MRFIVKVESVSQVVNVVMESWIALIVVTSLIVTQIHPTTLVALATMINGNVTMAFVLIANFDVTISSIAQTDQTR